MTAVVFDLETTGLNGAGEDFILTCAFLPLDKPEPHWMAVELENIDGEQNLARSIRDELAKHDQIIGFNSHGFDLRFLNNRLKRYGELQLLHSGSFDLMIALKQMFPYFGSNPGAKLDDFCKALGLEYQKTGYDPVIWAAAIQGNPEAMAYIVDHNKKDVLATRELYLHFFPVTENAE